MPDLHLPFWPSFNSIWLLLFLSTNILTHLFIIFWLLVLSCINLAPQLQQTFFILTYTYLSVYRFCSLHAFHIFAKFIFDIASELPYLIQRYVPHYTLLVHCIYLLLPNRCQLAIFHSTSGFYLGGYSPSITSTMYTLV